MDQAVARSALVRYLKKEFPQGYGKLIEVADAVGPWLAYVPETYPHYTSHTIAHSEAIVLQLSKLLFEDGRPARPVIRMGRPSALGSIFVDRPIFRRWAGRGCVTKAEAWDEQGSANVQSERGSSKSSTNT